MNKILATGLLVTLLYPVSEAGAVPCGNGGFYVGANFGVSLTKMKYRNSVDEQTSVIDESKTPDALALASFTSPVNGNYYSRDKVANAVSDVSGKSLKKNKSKFLAELSIGYDHRINDVMLGIDVNFGMRFGKSKKSAKGLALSSEYATASNLPAGTQVTVDDAKSTVNGEAALANQGAWTALGYGDNVIEENEYTTWKQNNKLYNSEQEAQLKVKNKFNISIMPRIGYLVTPQCELFITAGAMITNTKYTLSYNKGGETNSDWESINKSKTKVVPVVGGGIRYEFSENVFTKIEYNYSFKAKMSKAADGVAHKLDTSSHDVKLGIGYRF